MKNKIKIAVAGACGRMGSTIINLVKSQPDVELVWAFEVKNHPSIGKEIASGIRIADGFEKCENADVLIDFTVPQSTIDNLFIAKQKKVKTVIGTTGFSQNDIEKIKAIANDIAIVMSPNMSIGVNIMMEIVELATKLLGKDFEVEIIETHHHNKKDAPSGTALKISEIINRARGMDEKAGLVFGRHGITGPRTPEEIGIHAIRISEVVGEHTVMFGGRGEILEISHRCFSRESFAQGAIIAAKFISDKDKGLYQMKDVIAWLRASS